MNRLRLSLVVSAAAASALTLGGCFAAPTPHPTTTGSNADTATDSFGSSQLKLFAA